MGISKVTSLADARNNKRERQLLEAYLRACRKHVPECKHHSFEESLRRAMKEEHHD